MLACIACSKPELEDGDGDHPGPARAANPGSRDSVKSLTSQIKDMVLKFSGSISSREKTHHHRLRGSYATYLDYEAAAGSSSSTPAWDFTNVHRAAEQEKKPVRGPPGMVVVEEDVVEPKEWVAQVEPGVHITFISLPDGAGNDLKRIRFSREIFNKWQAQRWWGENFDRIMELYNVQRFNRQELTTPSRSEDGELQRESSYSRARNTTRHFSAKTSNFPPPSSVPDPTEQLLQQHFTPTGALFAGNGVKAENNPSLDAASRTTTSSRDDASVSISNASDMETTEWVEQDEPGVYITIRELGDGTRELRRVRFSRERFGEVHAKLWWQENRERIQAQYL